MESGVASSVLNFNEIESLLNTNEVLTKESYLYIETIEDILLTDIDIKEVLKRKLPILQTFRIFSNEFELLAKVNNNGNYRVVIISDNLTYFNSLGYNFQPINNSNERKFYLKESFINDDNPRIKLNNYRKAKGLKLVKKYYKSEKLGEFTRWKGVDIIG